MDKEKILSQNKKENLYLDEYEKHIKLQGKSFGLMFVLFICILILFIKAVCKEPYYDIMTIIGSVAFGSMGYHYTQLDPKDKKVFTKKIGIGTLLVSIGILVMPIINLISHSELGYYIGLILIVVGVFYIIFIIVKYNGKLISFKK